MRAGQTSFGAALLFVGLAILSSDAQSRFSPGFTPPALRAFTPADRIVVISPHPDDETLCCAGILQNARDRGASIGVVWITSGDGSAIDAWLTKQKPPKPLDYLRLGRIRMAEARAAATTLGVPEQRQIFLGFPDASLTCLLNQKPSAAKRCVARTQVSSVPYENTWRKGAPYSARGIESTLRSALESLAPTLILAPCASDSHPDHAALGRLLSRMSFSSPRAAIACWIVHAKPTWPLPRKYLPTERLLPPIHAAMLEWRSIPLTDEQRATKRAALLRYASQRRTMESFLLSFVRANELVALTPAS
jgi:LmbE family N-acetylglucosaminyl deacetylase